MTTELLTEVNEALFRAADRGQWLRIEDPTLRAFVGRYVADALREVASAVDLRDAEVRCVELGGDGAIPTKP